MNIYFELKKSILAWYLENINTWQRSNACREAFRQYIYDADGNYIIQGKAVSDFIDAVEKLF